MKHTEWSFPVRLSFSILASIMLLIALAAQPAATQAQGSAANPDVISAVAVDNSGNGWAWAVSDNFDDSYLLRIENGATRVAYSTKSSPNILPPRLQITRMVISAKGDSGWAIGYVTAIEDIDSPFFLKLDKGVWSVRKTSFQQGNYLFDITINADNTDGWMIAVGQDFPSQFLRLRNGAWDFAPGPLSMGDAGAGVVAINPDGQTAWAAGTNSKTDEPIVARWNPRSGWEVMPGKPYPLGYFAASIAVDNTGNGWLIAQEINEEQTNAYLVRLDYRLGPSRTQLDLSTVTKDPAPDTELASLAVDSLGRGWAVGRYSPHAEGSPYKGGLFMVRLRGAAANAVRPEQAGITDKADALLSTVSIGPGGGHAWAALINDSGPGALSELREPWGHSKPIAAAPLQGAGVCFAEVAFCMRGEFATYWQRSGGLEQFGYPITPEVQEQYEGKTYTVQYTQRARLEYHPENGASTRVLLGLLGNTLVEGRQGEAVFTPIPSLGITNNQWFRETGHNVGVPFLGYWKANGGLPVFGLPRSEAFDEKSGTNGDTYKVQYFERNRMEYHPENRGTHFEMLLGLLGTEHFMKRYGYAP